MRSRGRFLTMIFAALTLSLALPGRSTAAAQQPSLSQLEAQAQAAIDSIPPVADSIPAVPAKTGPRVTPVDIDTEKPAGPVLHYYDRHGNQLAEPVRFYTETDTVATPGARPVYPLFNGVSVGVNFFDAVMLLAGQRHGGIDLWADVSLHNWFFPTVEFGLGRADTRPDGNNFHYRSKLAPYFKVGVNYNFLYKSKPDYQVFLGLRAGFSSYHYDITDITVSSDYWSETSRFDILDQHAVSWYGEALAGIKVKLYRGLAMGWTIRYHFKFHTSLTTKPGSGLPGSDPWYIPGYGTTSPINATFSLIYSFGSKPRKEEPTE